ncbi:branched-chain amino acid transport system II carrier protein [Aerococcus sp. UMB1112A]|uniref:branched-chain amino acid transport system II carrier protein n=1 Tax=Aerococcus sp. UMB1112A TaxID=3050609 RepID=UPI00254DFBC5|nr:branched-chain amino acid transport system II carrier protein [Aerococcus sp. UMB1112A]MDK8502270.1 branched-chain amino acid transport system II carrier protein [Aerococcus sp. UMB1112A]
MMNKLSRSQFLQTSIMLFGLFFGAGNLIFPPLLGNQAGSQTWLALVSFAVTAVIFPVLGTIVVGKSEGLSQLANRVGPKFSIIVTTAIYLSIGPGLGIPRAGSVPFEMAVAPYIPEAMSLGLARLLYTLVFFALALWLCLKPNQLVKRVGKYLTPMLLLMIALMFVRVMFMPKGVAEPVDAYAASPVVQGFLEGYNTMDAVAALNFGFVISMAIRRFGVQDKHEVAKYTMKSGLLAGLVLFLVYAMLAAIGMVSSQKLAGADNGAFILTQAVQASLGNFGLVFLAGIFTLACLTTCVGLITSGAEYFKQLFKDKLSYRAWVFIWTGFSFLVANFGLNNLLAFSVPVLTVIYPVALVLILMGISQDVFNFGSLSYLVAATVSVALPLVDMLQTTFNVSLPVLSSLVDYLPLSSQGLGWLVPTLVALLISLACEKVLLPHYASSPANEWTR